jgi:hypothetical protein
MMYLKAYLLKLDPEQYTPPNFIGFSAQTSANMTQGLIDAKLDKRRKVSLCLESKWEAVKACQGLQ